MTVRHVATFRQPLRILADSKLKARADMKIFADNNVLIATAQSEKDAKKRFPDAAVLTLPNNEKKVDFELLMKALADKGINEVTAEAGRKINGALLAAGLVDEIVLYVAARVFGDTGLDMLVSPSPSSPADARHFELHDVSRLPADNLKIVYRAPAALSEILKYIKERSD